MKIERSLTAGKTCMDVLAQLERLAITEIEAHWVLGRLSVSVPNTLAEALDALENLRRTAGPAVERDA